MFNSLAATGSPAKIASNVDVGMRDQKAEEALTQGYPLKYEEVVDVDGKPTVVEKVRMVDENGRIPKVMIMRYPYTVG